MRNDTGSGHISGVFFRSLALFAILYQLRLVADDLADTAIFSATLFVAFAAAAFFAHKMKPLAAIITIGLVPWIARAFIAMPRLFVSGGNYDLAVSLDSLLLNFDRNNFVSLLPFYWAAATTWFSIRSRVFLRAAVIADAVLLTAIFSFTRIADFALYRWPIVMIILLAGIIFAQALALLFSMPPEIKLHNGEKFAAITAMLLLVFLGGLIFLGPSQKRAVQKGGGLLEPKLFSFDFSQFLRLDTEISMSDDLILIVKKDPDDNHILLRRSVLSGYSKKQGFFREELDDKTHPQRLPPRPVTLSPAEFRSSERVSQEYFLVNFDAAAFIGMKEPTEIIPYESWDSSSFKSAYAVESLTSVAVFNSDEEVIFSPDLNDLDLSEREFALYTDYDEDERIQALAARVTRGIDSYIGKVYAILTWLKYGEFRYSLKPGIAPDGDQLAWFLFNSKKGYCSYYAFAMTLMLRSLGIPSRVAAGFFVDTESGVFDYYPVRSDMAHAWVEVLVPGYGWIEFDPTSENLAEGEEFRFSTGVDPGLLEQLMREILENRSKLRVKIGPDSKTALTDSQTLARLAAVFAKKLLAPLLILLLIIILIIIRCGYLWLSVMCHNRRKKAVNLWKHARRRLRLAGYGCPLSRAESEWAQRSDAVVAGTYAMYLGAAAARFAPEYHNEDFIALQNAYRVFSESYRKNISPWRRFLAWVFPVNARLTVLLLLVFLAGSGGAQDNDNDALIDANNLFRSAIEAEKAEYWERAIDLYKEGSGKYPDDSRFPHALGDLYSDRALYGLAWDEYRKAEQINPFDVSLLFGLANTAGSLNRDHTSVAYYERLLDLDPNNRDAISSLGWMYYKVHRLRDGERLLNEAIERLGSNARFSMTLATLYSDMYHYEEGKRWYQNAIAQADQMMDRRSFTAVAHYNLSILESRFYHYDLSMEEANASVYAQNRASGLLMRGELYMRRLELEKAQADFNDAREVDPSPLAKVNLALTYQISGRLEEARLYALDCLKASDNSWMINYGIDPIRYKRDLHEILYKTYSGLAQAERFIPCGTLSEKIRSTFKSFSFRFYVSVHRKLYQKYSLAAGDAYGAKFVNAAERHATKRRAESSDAPPLDQHIQYFNAFETYPRRALFYLNKARDFEVALIPASESSYNLEEGILLKNKNLLTRALGEFESDWERDLVAQCYREFASRQALSGPARTAAAEELFALNRGALLQAGIALPVKINLYGEELGRREKVVYRALAKAGFTRVGYARPGLALAGITRYRLDITIQDGSASCELTDTAGESRPLRRVISLRSLSKADIYAFAGMLSNSVFRVE